MSVSARVVAREAASRRRWQRLAVGVMWTLFGLAGLLVVVRVTGGSSSVYGIAVLALLGTKMLSVQIHRRQARPPEVPHGLEVVAVVPFYNEDPDLLRRCLASIAAQQRRPQVVYVVDDGSDDPATAKVVDTFARDHAARFEIRSVVQPTNLGKREALAVAFRGAPRADVYVTVDSDTILDPAALDHLLREFGDPEVTAATGLVLALNHDVNLLTRIIDVRYVNAFLFDRASQSTVGAVLCNCGSLSAYRGDVVRDRLDDFLGQVFLGRPAVFGDDRRLTNYALEAGRVRLARGAVAHTAVPERVSHYVRQQVRWNKSFFRESLWAVGHLPLRHPAFAFSLLEFVSWVVFTTMLLLAIAVEPIRTGPAVAVMYLGYTVLMGLIRSAHYLEIPRPVSGPRDRLIGLLVSPVYGVLNLVLLLPLRLWSLATLRDSRWGTREEVEVTVASSPRAADPVPVR